LPPVSAAQPTIRPTSTPVVPRPAATAALAPAPLAPVTTTTTTAPRGGGIPPELGLPLLAGGASTLLSGFWLRRRERRKTPTSERDIEPDA
jgi:hypothetical protein